MRIFASEFQTQFIMAQTKKAFKGWDFSDFDFAHAESLADQPIRKGHIPFYGFNKALKANAVHSSRSSIPHQTLPTCYEL